MSRFKKGVAIEYVILSMALIAALVVTVLTSANLTVQLAVSHRKYIEKKLFLDSAAEKYIFQVQSTGSVTGLDEQFNENDYNIDFRFSTSALIATENREVILLVELNRVEGEYKVVTYRYGLL